MSVVGESGTPAVSDALAISLMAAEWVADRRNTEDWTSERQAELDTWLAQSLAHRIAYIRIEATWRRTERLAALRHTAHEPKNDGAARRSFWTRIAVVSGVLVAVVAMIAENFSNRTKEQTFATTVGGRELVTLSDGSQIELNTNTMVRVSLDDSARLITLDQGEAYFQVRHDARHLFVVVAGDHRVTDLGTQFSVRRDPDRLQVLLIEGRARFETVGNDPHTSSLEMSPGDKVVATPSNVTLTRQSVSVVKKSLGWRNGVIVFSNTSLADAAAEFNRYSSTKLVFADPKLANLTIEGTFQTNNIAAFADVLQAALGLHAEKQSEAIVISR
jgi:transmembrane sensor